MGLHQAHCNTNRLPPRECNCEAGQEIARLGAEIERLQEHKRKDDKLLYPDDLKENLRAEIERLRFELDTMNNQHRATAKQLADLGRERDNFAEQAALRDNRDADMQGIMQTNNELLAEIERLRKELQNIAEFKPGHQATLAQRALKQTVPPRDLMSAIAPEVNSAPPMTGDVDLARSKRIKRT